MASGAIAAVVRQALGDLRRTWPQLLLADFVAASLVIVAIVPISSSLLRLFLYWTDDGVLADADIVVFLLHPVGLLGFFLAAAVSVALLFAHSGVLMVIGYGAAEERRVTWLDAILYVVRHIHGLGRLAGNFVVRVGLLAVPFVAVIGGIYLLLLGKHDINYYLAFRPPEFRAALLLAIVLLAAFALLVLRLLGSWLLAEPLVLFGGVPGRDSLRSSSRLLAGREWKVAWWLAVWIAVLVLASWLGNAVVGLLGDLLIPPLGGSLALYAGGLALTLLLAGVVQLFILFVATALFALLLVRFYRGCAGPGALVPAPIDRGLLGEKVPVTVPGKGLLVGWFAIVAVVAGTGAVVNDSLDDEEPVAVIAHRGASRAAPENTLAAFERAVEEGADWIELDVQENAEGTVVVAHDSDLMKLAGKPLKVWEARDEDLRDLDIGSWFGPEFVDQRVPTLRQALLAARGRAGVIIELKYYGHADRLESRVAEIVERAGMQDRIQVMSLKRDGVARFAELRPAWPRGLLNTVSVGDLTRLDLDFLALNAAAAKSSVIRRAHRKGMKVFVWTVNDPVQMSVMMSRGADGLITDMPAVAREVIDVREELGPFGRLLVWIAGESGLLTDVDASSAAGDA